MIRPRRPRCRPPSPRKGRWTASGAALGVRLRRCHPLVPLGTLLDVTTSCKPGGGPYLSGTEWEFEDAWGGWNAGPRPDILVYRRTEEPKVGVKDPARNEKFRQYDLVEQFFGRFENPDGVPGRLDALRYPGALEGTPYYLTSGAFGSAWAERIAAEKGVPVAPLRAVLARLGETEVPEHEIPERLARWAEEFAATREQLSARIAAEKGVPAARLRAVLARYGETEVPDDQIPERLARWAEEFVAARKQLEHVNNEPPEAGAARHRAAALLGAGDLDGAQAVLAEARQP